MLYVPAKLSDHYGKGQANNNIELLGPGMLPLFIGSRMRTAIVMACPYLPHQTQASTSQGQPIWGWFNS